jgi:hypothetical protein
VQRISRAIQTLVALCLFVSCVHRTSGQIKDTDSRTAGKDPVAAIVATIPSSVESVFCVEAPFKLGEWTGEKGPLTILGTADYFTTRLCACTFKSLKIDIGQIRCAVGACEAIISPAKDPQTGTVTGAFRSHRIEILLLTKDLPSDWLKSIEHDSGARQTIVAGYRAVSIDVESDGMGAIIKPVLVSNPARNVVFVSNDEKLLSAALELYKSGPDKGRAHSIGGNATFQAAAALVSESRQFWGVRFFDRGVPETDPTSVRNRNSAVELYDPAGIFVAMRDREKGISPIIIVAVRRRSGLPQGNSRRESGCGRRGVGLGGSCGWRRLDRRRPATLRRSRHGPCF